MTRRRFLLLAALTLLHSALNACTPPPKGRRIVCPHPL
jgi:hypothetical protein